MGCWLLLLLLLWCKLLLFGAVVFHTFWLGLWWSLWVLLLLLFLVEFEEEHGEFGGLRLEPFWLGCGGLLCRCLGIGG